MEDPFNLDRYKQRQTAEDQAEIQRQTEDFLKNGGKIEIIASSVSSGIGELSFKERSDMRKRAKSPRAAKGGVK